MQVFISQTPQAGHLTAIGKDALASNTTASWNVAVGYEALEANTGRHGSLLPLANKGFSTILSETADSQ